MGIKDAFITRYKQTLFKRYDEDSAVFYFSAKDFVGLSAEEYCFVNNHDEKLKGYFYSYDSPIENRLLIFEHGIGAASLPK